MNIPKTNCPDCNSLQKFSVKERELNEDKILRYTKCTICKAEFYLEVYFKKERVERARKHVKKIRAIRAKYDR